MSKSIHERVVNACGQIIQSQSFICIIDLFKIIGLLQPIHEEYWRKGKIPELETFIQGSESKITEAINCLKEWALENKLIPLKVTLHAATSGSKKSLRYSISGEPAIETLFQTYYFSPKLSVKDIRKLQDQLEKEPELVVFWTISDSKCAKCDQQIVKGAFLLMEGDSPLCLNCAGIGDLVFLGRGDPKLTRRAHKYSSKSAVVVRFSKTRKRYEREGLLVQPEALKKAESEV